MPELIGYQIWQFFTMIYRHWQLKTFLKINLYYYYCLLECPYITAYSGKPEKEEKVETKSENVTKNETDIKSKQGKESLLKITL